MKVLLCWLALFAVWQACWALAFWPSRPSCAELTRRWVEGTALYPRGCPVHAADANAWFAGVASRASRK